MVLASQAFQWWQIPAKGPVVIYFSDDIVVKNYKQAAV